MGVVTPYRHQQTEIEEVLANLLLTQCKCVFFCGCFVFQCGYPGGTPISAENHVEVNTVDRYQGSDKDCIIISYVRSNPNKNVSAYTIF